MQMKETYLKRGLTAAVAASIIAVFAANISARPEGQTVIIAERSTSSITPDNGETREAAVDKPSESAPSITPNYYDARDITLDEPPNEGLTTPESDITNEQTRTLPEPEKADAPDALGLVNINTAGLEELKTLNGIGDVKAQAVIDYRNAHGPFSSAEQITEVKGIGEKTLEKIRDYITV